MDASLQNTVDMATTQAMAAQVQSSGNVKLHGKTSMATIDKQSKEFENMFMTQMLQPMFENMKVDPTFGGGHGEEVMRSFLVQEYGKAISNGGRLGIAAAVKAAMIRAQESGQNNQPTPSPLTSSQGAAAYASAQ